MGGRTGGGIVLLVAVLTLVVVPRLITPGVAGRAQLDAGPPPPAAGTCLRDPVYPSFDEDGSMLPMDGLSTVGSDQPHWGEIYVVDGTPGPAVADGGSVARCWDSGTVQDYLGAGPTGSTSALGYEATALGPDTVQWAGGQRWSACVLSAAEALTASVAGASATGDPPPTLGLCYEDAFAAFGVRETSCHEPHRGELLEYLTLDVALPPLPTGLHARCVAAAERATGRAGLAGERGLEVQTGIFAWFDDRQSRFVSLPLPAGAGGATAFCGIRAVDGRALTASLRRIGKAPLPWAG